MPQHQKAALRLLFFMPAFAVLTGATLCLADIIDKVTFTTHCTVLPCVETQETLHDRRYFLCRRLGRSCSVSALSGWASTRYPLVSLGLCIGSSPDPAYGATQLSGHRTLPLHVRAPWRILSPVFFRYGPRRNAV